MTKQLIIFLILTLMLSACSFTEFGKNVDAGKKAMKNQYYRAALHYFELAKIDKPNDSELVSLTKMATDGVEKSLDKMKPRSSFADNYKDYEQMKISQGQEPSWREWELDRLDQNDKRDKGFDKNGQTFEEYVTTAELKQTEPGKLNYESLLSEWLANYDH